MWMKPSDLPLGFQGWCWVSRRLLPSGIIMPPTLRYIRRAYDKAVAEVHEYGVWFSIYDADNRLLVVEEPLSPTEEEWTGAGGNG